MDPDEAFSRIVREPGMLAECKANWQAMSEAARAPALREGVMRVIASRFPIFPQPERSEGEWRAWWAVYVEALGDLPEESLELAMRAYVREPDAEFLPKPGKLRDLARQATTPSARAAGIAARCAAYEPPRARMERAVQPPVLKPTPTPEERSREVEAARDVMRQLDATSAKFRGKPYEWRPMRPRARAHECRSAGTQCASRCVRAPCA